MIRTNYLIGARLHAAPGLLILLRIEDSLSRKHHVTTPSLFDLSCSIKPKVVQVATYFQIMYI